MAMYSLPNGVTCYPTPRAFRKETHDSQVVVVQVGLSVLER